MAKIIIYGDINYFPVYLKVDGGKEMVIRSGYPRYVSLSSGTHHIEATTLSKAERATMSFAGSSGGIGGAVMANSNSLLSGELSFGPDDVLLIQLELKGTKTKLYNKMVSSREVGEYVDTGAMLEYGEKEPGQKNKWIALLLCLCFGYLGVHRFYEKKIYTGLLYIAAWVLLFICLFADIGGLLIAVPACVLGIGWPVDFLRILFRKS